MERTVSFSVVIPATRPFSLFRLLEKLCPQVCNDDEIVVVLNKEHAQFDRLISEFPSVKFIRCVKPGPAAARNAGVAVSNGTHIIMLDDDTIPSEKLVLSYRNAFIQNPDTLVCGGKISPFPVKSIISRYIEAQPFTWKHSLEKKIFVTCNCAVLKELCVFDEEYRFAFEDVSFSKKIPDCTAILSDNAFVFHKSPRSYFSFCLKFFRYGMGKADFEFLDKPVSERKSGFQLFATSGGYFRKQYLLTALMFGFLELTKYVFYITGYICKKNWNSVKFICRNYGRWYRCRTKF